MTPQVRKNVMDMFIDGARRGFTIATTSLLPNVVMAFVIIQALKVTGLLEIVGRVCEPVMALWGLPGESATVLLAAVMSMGGGVGVCASLVVAMVNPRRAPSINISMTFLRTCVVISRLLLHTAIFQLRDPHTQQVRAHKFED